MNWLKDVIVDIAVTIFIIAAIFVADTWMMWIIGAYTLVLLLAKAAILFGDNFLQLMNKAKSGAPEWFSHLLYAINTASLFYLKWWFIAAGWVLIWALSFAAERKLKARAGSSS